MSSVRDDPHAGTSVLEAGTPIGSARAAVILVHGRGGTAENILSLARELEAPGFCYLAPQAAGSTWYPSSFLARLEQNEPFLSSGLRVLGSLVDRVSQRGIVHERIVLLGFSQGACLTLEFAARNARRYGGIIGLTGGLIGPDDAPRAYAGSFDGTPVFLGSSDPDPHVPAARVEETRDVYERMGAEVTMRLYPNMGHTINADELQHARATLDAVVTEP
jgi:phospholipase/carboxylesterase